MRKLIALLFLLPLAVMAQTFGNISAAGNIPVYGYSADVYHYSLPVVIQSSQVPETETDYPVVVSLTNVNLKTTANGGHVWNASGYDIVFGTDQFCTSTLSFESGLYNATTGQIIAYVKVPSVSSSANTTIYMCFGDSSIATSQASAASVWSNGYVSVFHGGDNGTLSVADSLGTNNMTNSGVVTATGDVGGGMGLSGTVYAKKTSPTGLPTGSSQRTVEAWAYMASNPATNNVYPAAYGNLAACSNTETTLFGSYSGIGGGPPYWYIEYAVCNDYLSIHAIDTGAWHYIAAVLPSGATKNGQTLGYYDAVLQTIGTYHGASGSNVTVNTGTPTELTVGNSHGTTNPSGTVFDEVRHSSVARSAGWIAATYNNISSPSTFYTIGSLGSQ